jgi:hypothetical protein
MKELISSWIINSGKDLNARIGQAWSAATRMKAIWKSHLPSQLKRDFFPATVVSILLYGCETWTNAINQKLDGAYTNLLRYASNVQWTEHMINVQLYGNLPKNIARMKRMRYVGHCSTAENQPIHHLVILSSKIPKYMSKVKVQLLHMYKPFVKVLSRLAEEHII